MSKKRTSRPTRSNAPSKPGCVQLGCNMIALAELAAVAATAVGAVLLRRRRP
jgi:hypothetical protein